MWLSLEADEPDQAVRVAQNVDPRRHSFPINEAYYWIRYGQALAQLTKRQDDAVRALRTAEQIQPTMVLRNQQVRETLGELLAGGLVRVMAGELRGMAHRAGVLVEQIGA